MGDGRQTSMAGKLERRKDMAKMKWGGGREICFSSNSGREAACPSKLSSVAKGGECRLGIRLDRL